MTTDSAPFYLAELDQAMTTIPPDSIVSRTLFSSERLKAVLFGFASGQELSEHTAAVPAVLHFVRGRAELVLGGETRPAGPGTWVHLAARLPHSVRAQGEVVMLLLLLRGEAGSGAEQAHE
jgi:quercetin dioxygenase-like cupin family protein